MSCHCLYLISSFYQYWKHTSPNSYSSQVINRLISPVIVLADHSNAVHLLQSFFVRRLFQLFPCVLSLFVPNFFLLSVLEIN